VKTNLLQIKCCEETQSRSSSWEGMRASRPQLFCFSGGLSLIRSVSCRLSFRGESRFVDPFEEEKINEEYKMRELHQELGSHQQDVGLPFLVFPWNNQFRQDTCRAVKGLKGRTETGKRVRSSPKVGGAEVSNRHLS